MHYGFEDAQVALYYAQHEGAYVFNDFDIYVEGMDFTYDNYLISRIEGNVDMKQRNLYNIYVFERNGRDGGISSVSCFR